MNQQATHTHGGGIAGRLNMAGWRKHYVAAMTADEEAWPQREPGGNLGRIFIILLLLHVFLIGAVVLYNVISPKNPPAATAAASKTPPLSKSTAAKIANANPTAMRVGETDSSANAAPGAPKAEVKAVEMGIYEVRSGDNVPGIAAMLGVQPEELIKFNNLDTTELFPGRKLTYPKKAAVPALPPAKSLQPGLGAIALAPSKSIALKSSDSPSPPRESSAPVKLKDHPATTAADAPPKTTAARTPSAADDPPTTKKTKTKEESAGGTKAKTEGSKSAKTGAKSEKTAKPESGAKTTAKTKEGSAKRSHIVGPKETLYSIAKKYGVKVDSLQKANGIKDPTKLSEGTKLVIPSKS